MALQGRPRSQAYVLVAVAFLLAGCRAKLSDAARSAAAGLKSSVEATDEKIVDAEKRLRSAMETAEYRDFLKPYAEREKWLDKPTQAKTKLKEAVVLQAQAVKLLDENRAEDEAKILEVVKSAKAVLMVASDLSDYPTDRRNLLVEAKANSKTLLTRARNDAEAVRDTVESLIQEVAETKKRHPAKAKDLDKRIAPSLAIRSAVGKQLMTANLEGASVNPDFAHFIDACVAITEGLEDATEQSKELKTRMPQLDRSYTKTLIDMRADLSISFERTSWDEYSDSDWENTTVLGPAPVAPEVYAYLAPLADTDDDIDENIVTQAGIDTRAGMEGSSCSFSVSDATERYYLKYRVTEDTQQSESDWEPVDEATFETSEDNLGMDVLIKPYGMYDDEAIRVATPTGMAFVGNSHYGHWVTHPSRGRYWDWYPDYSFWSGGYGGYDPFYYQYDDYTTWNRSYRGRKPYYGRNEDEPSYGSFASRTRTRFANSSFGRTGGFRMQDSSVRGAGESYRGGGPGGGGK